MPIDTAKALAAEPTSTRITWQHRDVQLYHLGIGAGVPATDPAELSYTLESQLQVLPSFATVAGGQMAVADGLSTPGIDVDLAAVLHGAQSVEVHRPLPTGGAATQHSAVSAVYDKGKAAVIVLRSDATDADGPLWSCESQFFVKGEGGFGGQRGPSADQSADQSTGRSAGRPGSGRLDAPTRAPDHTVERRTREDQALLYRLSGDWNPLHADPEFARLAGFDRPILHGLCSYGVALKAVVDTALDGDVTRVGSFGTRFAGVVYPGETLRVRIWHQTDSRLQITTHAVERDEAPVLSDAVVTHT